MVYYETVHSRRAALRVGGGGGGGGGGKGGVSGLLLQLRVH